MAIRIQFGNRSILEPGSYGRTVNGTTQRQSAADFGKVMIIDTGIGSYFGGGAGVNGQLANGKNTVYEFTEKTTFKNFVKGGVLWDIADYLFSPSKTGNGASAVQVVKASTTTAPEIVLTVSGSGNITKTGTISTSTASASVTGVSTKFLSELRVGDIIKTSANVLIGTVLTIDSDTSLQFTANAATTNSGIAFKGQFAQTQGGVLTIKVVSEGLSGNGVTLNGKLLKGYGVKMTSGILDTNKFVLNFYEGTYRGVNNLEPSFNIPTWNSTTTYSAGQSVYYNGFVFTSVSGSNINRNPATDMTYQYWTISDYSDVYGQGSIANSTEKLIVQSPEFSSINEFNTWAQVNFNFLSYFQLSTTVNGSGLIDSADLATYANYTIATGGTESYSSGDIDRVLQEITEEDNTFFLLDNYGVNAKSVNNNKILSFIKANSEFAKFAFIGGGYSSNELNGTNGSLDIAKSYNSKNTIVVHSGIVRPKIGGGEQKLSSFYHAAIALGRTAGLEPQVPTTWKDLDISYPIHDLNKSEREKCLLGGVWHLRFVNGKNWIVNQSINTLQKNDNLVDTEGNSYELSIERINAQLIKELCLNSRVLFVGGNYSTASPIDVKLFTENYLTFRTVNNGKDNLIISFQDVKVSLDGDAWNVTFGYVPNGPINKLLFTGVTLDAKF
jgi:hypothetical protein